MEDIEIRVFFTQKKAKKNIALINKMINNPVTLDGSTTLNLDYKITSAISGDLLRRISIMDEILSCKDVKITGAAINKNQISNLNKVAQKLSAVANKLRKLI